MAMLVGKTDEEIYDTVLNRQNRKIPSTSTSLSEIQPVASVPEAPKPAVIGSDEEIYQRILGERPSAREALTAAQGVKPDEYAQASALAQNAGVPDVQYVLDNKKEFEQQQATEESISALGGAYVTPRWLTENPDNAKLASDSVPQLVEVETELRRLNEPTPPPAEGKRSVVMDNILGKSRSLTASVVGNWAGSSLEGLAQIPGIVDRFAQRTQDALADVTGERFAAALLGRYYDPLVSEETLKAPGQFLKDIAKSIDVAPENRDWGNDVAAGVGQVAAQITAAILTGGAASAVSLGTMFGQGIDQVTDDVQRAGAYQTAAGDVAMLGGGVVTAVTEKFGLDLILNKIPATVRSKIGRILSGATVEASQEIAEKVLNNLIAIGLYEPERPVFDYSALYEGSVGGAVGAIVGAVLPGHKAVRTAAGVSKAIQTARESPLGQRSPAKAAEFLADNFAENNLSVHIPVQTLDKIAGDVPDLIYEGLGITHAQVEEARLRGSDVSVDPKLYLQETQLDPTRYDPYLNDIRFGPLNLSANEAQTSVERMDEVGIMASEALALEQENRLTDGRVDTALRYTERQLGLQALFRTAQEAGMTTEQYTEFLAMKARAAEVAKTRLTERMLRQQQRELTAEYQNMREGLREEAEQIVMRDDLYGAFNAIGAQRLDYKAVAEILQGDQATIDRLPKQMAKQTGKGGKITNKARSIVAPKNERGMDPELLANQFGFEGADIMLFAMLDNPSFSDAVETQMDKLARAKYENLLDTRQTIDAAITALHTDQQGEVLVAELNALKGAQSGGIVSVKQFKALAEQQIQNLALMDINPTKFLVEEERKAREVGKFLRVGQRIPGTQQFTGSDRIAAAQSKFEQIMNFQYAKMAPRLVEKIAGERDLLAGLQNPNQKHPTIDADYLDQIRERLAPFDFSDRKRQKNADDPKPYLTMQLSAWNNLVEDIRQLRQQGINQRKLFVKGREIELQTAVTEMVEAAENVPDLPRTARENVGNPRFFDPAKSVAAGWGAFVRKTESMIRALDNGKMDGVFHKYLFRPLTDAMGAEINMFKATMEPVLEDLRRLPPDVVRRLNKSQYIPELGRNMKGSELLMVALNSGNVSNFNKMLDGSKELTPDGMGWSPANVRRVLQTRLGPEEAAWVQKVWDAFDSLRPEVEAVYKRQINGVFKRIEPNEVNIGGVVLRGGYFPMLYQQDHIFGRPGDTQVQNLMDNTFYVGSVFSGMTEARVENYSAPIELDITKLAGGLHRATHFITHLEPVQNVRKLLNNKEIGRAITAKVGPEYYQEFQRWLEAVATNNADRSTSRHVNAFIQLMRRNLTVGVLGASYTTLVSQSLGIFSAVSVLGRGEGGTFSNKEGVKWMLIGMDEYVHAPFEVAAEAQRLSVEMQNRIENYDRDAARALQELKGNPFKNAYSRAQQASLLMIGRMQFYTVDVPVWTGAFNKGLAEGKTAEDAVIYADSVLRTSQGSGHTKDLTALQRKKGLTQLLTMFSTYTSVAFDISLETAGDINRSKRNAPGAIARLGWLFGLTAVLDALMRQEGPPDDDEGKTAWWSLRVARYAMQNIPVVGGAIGSVMQGFDPSFTPAETLINSISNVIKLMAKKIREGTINESEEWSLKDLRKIVQLTGLGFGVPGTVQINRVLSAVEAEDDASLYDFFIGYKKEKDRTR